MQPLVHPGWTSRVGQGVVPEGYGEAAAPQLHHPLGVNIWTVFICVRLPSTRPRRPASDNWGKRGALVAACFFVDVVGLEPNFHGDELAAYVGG